MKISASVLDCNNRVDGVYILNRTNISYIHIDAMDGEFVSNIQFDDFEELKEINRISKYPLDVHLMMADPTNYIDNLANMNIEFITIHLEIEKDIKKIISQIKNLGYKVGLSIKPNTSLDKIKPYLDMIDLILVMSVEPGLGGQGFITTTVDRVDELRELIGKRKILIEVDGGINEDNITLLDKADISVVGSYIVKSDNYNDRVNTLLDKFNNK